MDLAKDSGSFAMLPWKLTLSRPVDEEPQFMFMGKIEASWILSNLTVPTYIPYFDGMILNQPQYPDMLTTLRPTTEARIFKSCINLSL